MKLHFDPNLDYHTSISPSNRSAALFRRQDICRAEFTVIRDAAAAQQTMAFAWSELGIGNRLHLLDDVHRGDGDRHRQNLRLPAPSSS